MYFEDGTIEDCCPPLRALIHIMAHGHFEGRDASDPAIRAMFTRESLLTSEWYAERLTVKQRRDIDLWERHVGRLSEFLASPGHRDEAQRLGIPRRLEHARAELERVRSPEYVRSLVGTIGADPVHRPVRGRPRSEGAEAEAVVD
jgi:hypothetical protein